MKFYDTHMHSYLSFDSEEDPTAYLSKKTEVLTFTEHLDLDNTIFDTLTNIPEENYNDKLVGKTYIKVNGSYYYGEAIAMSIYEVAVKTKANCEATGKEVPQYVLDVIAAVDGTSGN